MAVPVTCVGVPLGEGDDVDAGVGYAVLDADEVPVASAVAGEVVEAAGVADEAGVTVPTGDAVAPDVPDGVVDGVPERALPVPLGDALLVTAPVGKAVRDGLGVAVPVICVAAPLEVCVTPPVAVPVGVPVAVAPDDEVAVPVAGLAATVGNAVLLGEPVAVPVCAEGVDAPVAVPDTAFVGNAVREGDAVLEEVDDQVAVLEGADDPVAVLVLDGEGGMQAIWNVSVLTVPKHGSPSTSNHPPPAGGPTEHEVAPTQPAKTLLALVLHPPTAYAPHVP